MNHFFKAVPGLLFVSLIQITSVLDNMVQEKFYYVVLNQLLKQDLDKKIFSHFCQPDIYLDEHK